MANLQDKAHEVAMSVLRSIQHFRSLTGEELMAIARTQPRVVMASLWAHPEFRGWICGPEGRNGLEDLTLMAIARDDAAHLALHPRTLANAIEWQFCDRFLKKQHALTPDNVDRMLKSSIRHTLDKRVDQCIAVPCRVTDDALPETFHIGSIEFVRTAAFIQKMKSEGFTDERSWLDTPALSGALENNPWIALATFNEMDPELGRQHAHRAVQAALEFLAVLLDPWRGDRLITAKTAEQPIATLHFSQDADKTWSIGWSKRNLQTSFGDGWYDYLRNELGFLLDAGGQAISGLLKAREPYPLEQRFLDGLHWFGIAAREASPASKIATCVFALERLSMTRDIADLGKIGKSFAQRTVVLAKEFSGLDVLQWFPKLETLYDVRSRLAHGDLSPTDPVVPDNASFALSVTRAALLGSLVTYGRLNRGQGTDEELRRYFEVVAPVDPG